MARTMFGITVGRADALADATVLEEAIGELNLAKREMEDFSWRLLNPVTEQVASDMPPLDRAKVISRGIKYWVQDPIVGQSVDMLADYLVGKGIDMPQTDNEDLAKVIARFWTDPSNKRIITSPEAQRQKVIELELMGNVYPVAFVNEATGHVKLSDIPPTEVSEIIAHPQDRKRHIYLRRNYTPARYDFKEGSWTSGETERRYYCFAFERPLPGYGPSAIQKGEVFHWSINRLSDGKFGNPRVARIIDWVRAYNEFMRARVSLMRALAMFAWQRKVKGNPSDVRKIVNAHQAGMLGGGETADPNGSIPNQYAATVSTNENVSWEQMKTDTGGGQALQDGRMIKGQIGMGAGWPLHYLGDIGGANLATATAMELPVLKMIEGRQGHVRDCICELIDFAIIEAIKAGELKPAPVGKFSADRLKLRGNRYQPADMETEVDGGSISEAETEDAKRQKLKDQQDRLKTNAEDRSIYDYSLVMPSILKRQTSEVINAVTNLLKTVDPYSQNVDASRWALRFSLEVMEIPNPQSIVDTIFPPGYEYPTDINAERGRSDTREGDGRGQVDFRANRKPPAEQRVGAKGGKEARQPGEIDTSVAEAEAALLDLIDTAQGHYRDSLQQLQGENVSRAVDQALDDE